MQQILTKEDITTTILKERRLEEQVFVLKQEVGYVIIFCEKIKAFPADGLIAPLTGQHRNAVINPRYFGCGLDNTVKGTAWGWKDDKKNKIVIYNWSWVLEPSKNEFIYTRAHEYLAIADALVEEFTIS